MLAQRGIPRDDKVTVSSTKVTKIKKRQTRTPKTLKTYEADVSCILCGCVREMAFFTDDFLFCLVFQGKLLNLLGFRD